MNPVIGSGRLRRCVKFVRSLIWPFFLFCAYLLFFCGWVLHYAFQSGSLLDTESVVVQIPRGADVRQIGDILAGAGLVRRDFRFVLVTRALGVGNHLPAGEFELKAGQSPVQVIRQLAMAKPLQHSVTIPEGLRASEVADIFARDGWCNHERFVDRVRDPAFIQSLKIKGVESLEGYLYPDTYFLVRGHQTEESLIRMMVSRFQQVFGRQIKDYKGGLKQHELVILASIVEKETGNPGERSVIAAVFLNRLRRGMRLQSDPTVIYGLKDFSGNLTRKDLKISTPYNTYVIDGLPAGPICNPGGEALYAVLHPASEKYLYFVSKNDGSHYFSKTLREHNQAVNKYQKKGRHQK